MGTTDKLMTHPLKCCYKCIGKFDKTKTRGTKMKFLDNLLEGREDQAYALLRIVTGFLFIWHGAQKLFNYPKDFPYPLNPLMYSAGTIELVGGLSVMIGLFTRPAAFICSGTMAVAYWTSHKIPQKSKYITKSKKTTTTQKIQRKPNNTTKAQK